MVHVAILIPTFNSARTIRETLESVQRQGPILDQISAVYIADDCSTDDTLAIAKSVWYVHIPLVILKGDRNLGEYENVNRAMEIIREKADWVLILHSDDIAKSNWLETMISRIHVCSIDVGSICSSWDNLHPDGSISRGEDDPSKSIVVIEGGERAVRDTLMRGCWWHISGCAIRTSTFDNVGRLNSELPVMGDWEWLLRCLSQGWSIEYIPRTLIVYRQHKDSLSHIGAQRDYDILVGLRLASQYVWALSCIDLLHFHSQRWWFAVRRLGRACVQRRLRRCLVIIVTMGRIGLNLLRCLDKARDMPRLVRS